MWIILHELNELGAAGTIIEGKRVIRGVRLRSSLTEASTDYVYIYESKGTASGDDETILSHGSDIICVPNAQIEDIFNRVLSIFEKYLEWSDRIDEALLSISPFQPILDIAHEMIPDPMFFGQRNLHILAITHGYTKEELFEEWDDMKAYSAMPMRMVERLNKYGFHVRYPEEIDPAVMPAIPEYKVPYYFTIRTNCSLRGQIWGHLYCYHMLPELNPCTLQLLRYVADIFEKLLNKSQYIIDEQTRRFTPLAELIEGNAADEESLKALRRQLAWDTDTSLVLYKVVSLDPNHYAMIFEWLCNSIIEKLPNAAVFFYRNAVIAVAASKDADLLLSGIKTVISMYAVGEYHCGVSFPFTGIRNIDSGYEQASFAIELSEGIESVHYFQNCFYSGMTKAFKSHTHWRSWVLPALFDLIKNDKEYNTEYYKTLYYLLINQNRYADTAKALFIHRNTLAYRLDKLQTVLNVDLRNESVLAYLRFCYSLLSEDHPV
jgi:hypothetical protein